MGDTPTPASSEDRMHLPWSWCGHCQRTYATGTCRLIRFAADALHPHPSELRLCPYDDCGGSTARYQWQWANVRLEHPDYPTTPVQGTVYTR